MESSLKNDAIGVCPQLHTRSSSTSASSGHRPPPPPPEKPPPPPDPDEYDEEIEELIDEFIAPLKLDEKLL